MLARECELSPKGDAEGTQNLGWPSSCSACHLGHTLRNISLLVVLIDLITKDFYLLFLRKLTVLVGFSVALTKSNLRRKRV